MDVNVGIAMAGAVLAVAVIAAAAVLLGRLTQIDKTVSASEDRLRSALETVQLSLAQVTTSNQESLIKVTQSLGALGESTAGLLEETGKLGELREAFKVPGPRGGFGELLLENALRDVLSADQYATQHSFADGSRVDAAVRIGERLVPIDSKFPTAAFEELVAAANDDERRKARRTFLRAVRGHVDDVARYIKPDEGTVDYALMYVPAENVFLQIVIRERGEEADAAPIAYAQSRGVILTSPNTLYLYLQTIATALRGFAIERHAREISDQVSRFTREFARVLQDYSVLGTHLSNARSKYEDVDRALDEFNERLTAAAEGLPPENGPSD